MADRTVYGNTHSENGWRMVDDRSCQWYKVPGAEHVNLQIREGVPATLLLAFAGDYHVYIEHLRDGDSACWTRDNSVGTSNHLSGTGEDLNWNGPDGKTFRLGISKERAYPGAKSAALDELLEFYEGMIFCGGYWSIQDWMHFQLGGKTAGPENAKKVEDFIRRKIRADGRSTFRREGESTGPPVQPVPDVLDAVRVLSQALSVPEATATDLLPDIRFGLIHSECNTTLRIAHWLAQMGHESANWVATEEYEDGDECQNRWRYKGRTWIQITWEENYRKFGHWLRDNGLIDDPEFFVNNPKVLAATKWRAVGPAWYWTQTVRDTRTHPTCNEAADYDDIVNVTQIINGGTNGLPDRQKRYNRAIALGDQLLTLIGGGDDELADPAVVKQIQEIWDALFTRRVSQSIYRDVGEAPRWQLPEILMNDDGMEHQKHVEDSAHLGNVWELDRIIKLARGQGAVREPWAIQHGTAVLAEIERENPAVLSAYLAWEAELNRRSIQ